jgi:hypothetical protein
MKVQPSGQAVTIPRTGAHGQWLRGQRQARGWTIGQMARNLRAAAALAGDTVPGDDCLAVMIRRWEKGSGISERYQIHYCRAFQIPPRHFGGTLPPEAAPGEPSPDSSACDHEPVIVVLVIVVPASGAPS